MAGSTTLVRARNADGTYKGDDPLTPDVNEVWVSDNSSTTEGEV
jgi:hypothetical protein